MMRLFLGLMVVLLAILLVAQIDPTISTREIIRAMTIAVFFYLATVCYGVAKMKGKNQIQWGALGLLFGPFAIAYLILVQNAYAGAIDSLDQRVNVFYKLGLLGEKGERAHGMIVKSISQVYREEWEEDFDKHELNKKDSLHADLSVLKYGGANIWWKDTEADVLKGNAVYVKTLKEWAAISNGVFSPTNFVESWKSEKGPIEVTFQFNNRKHTIAPKYLEDYLDMNVLKEINKMLPKTGRRYEMLAAFDQTAVVLCVNGETKAALIRRGWRFAW